MAVVALAGAACAGGDASQAEVPGAPVASTAGEDLPDDVDVTPSSLEQGPTCHATVAELTRSLDGAADVSAALVRTPGADDQQALAAEVAKLLDQAAAHARRTGQDQAETNLLVLATMLGDVRAALGAGATGALEAYTPAYFEHGYAAEALRDLAENANLAPCGQLADLVVGAGR